MTTMTMTTMTTMMAMMAMMTMTMTMMISAHPTSEGRCHMRGSGHHSLHLSSILRNLGGLHTPQFGRRFKSHSRGLFSSSSSSGLTGAMANG